MIGYTQTRVLLPERILKEKANWTEQNFYFVVRNYLLRYPKYQLVRVEGPFAICDRGEVDRERRRKP